MKHDDIVAIPAGVTAIPDVLRMVAHLANAAGLKGYRVVDVEVGLDLDAARAWLPASLDERESMPNPALQTRALIKYESLEHGPQRGGAVRRRLGRLSPIQVGPRRR